MSLFFNKRHVNIDLNPEEILLDAGGGGIVERPLSFWAFGLVIIAVVFSGFVVLGRLASISVFSDGSWERIAEANSGKEVDIRAPRGIIYDRFQKPLLENVPAFRAELNLSELYKNFKTKEERHAFLVRLSEVARLELTILEEVINTNQGRYSKVTVPGFLDKSQVIAIHEFNSPVALIASDYKRHYIYNDALSHILGYVGLVNANDLKNFDYLEINDEVGRAGLELAYDKELRGEDGKSITVRNAKGSVIDTLRDVPPVGGSALTTTIDIEFQEYFKERLEDELRVLGRTAGVGLAMNPGTGEVLAMVSLPSFNNNVFGNDNATVRRLLSDKGRPLFNRVVSGVYTPGSAIKPLVALAALKENLVDPLKTVFSSGYIELPNPYNPDKPSRFVDWKAHGLVNMYSAIARSSNVYFYTIGGGFGDIAGLGIEKMKKYWEMFGYGRKTGIDLPYEAEGFLPFPEEKEKRTGQMWRIGDTYNISIGQGDFLTTPIQLLAQISALANGGMLYEPYVVKRNDHPLAVRDFSLWKNDIEEVRKGMRETVEKPYGTAFLLSSLPFDISGKTGSSQIANNTKTNAFFVGYAPSDNPVLAILILVEDAREGSLNTIPIARDVFEWYYYKRM